MDCVDLRDISERPDQPRGPEYQTHAVTFPLVEGEKQATAVTLPDEGAFLSGVAARQGKVFTAGGSGMTMIQSSADIKDDWDVKKYSRFADAFRDITFVGNSSSHLFATGSKGEIYRSQDGGKSWESFNRVFHANKELPDDKQIDEMFSHVRPYEFIGDSYGIAFANNEVGAVVGETNILYTRDGGQNWSPAQFPAFKGAFQGVTFVSAKDGWLVGSSGIVMRTQDGGAHWQTVPVDTQGTHLMSVSFADSDHGCMVGRQSRVWCTANGGTTWQPGEVAGESESTLTRVQMRSAQQGWAVNRQGEIYRTEDGGAHWALWMDVVAASRGKLQGAEFWGLTVDDTHAWAVGVATDASERSSPLIVSW